MNKSFAILTFSFGIFSFSLPALAITMPDHFDTAQGSTVEITIPRGDSTYIDGTFEGEKILFQKNPDNFHGYLGINRLGSTGTKHLNISLFTPGKGSNEFSLPVNISRRDFRTQYFTLPPATQKLFEQDYQTPTWNLIYGAMANPVGEPLWTGKFKLPTNGRITLGFGDKLYINKKYSGSHFGIDYANKTGTPVYAANDGIIKLASMTPAYGNVIVIDHGLHIYSMYLHLDSFSVKAGDRVKQGDLIGKIGSTGLSNGPHLHFTMFVDRTIVDSDQWMK